MVVGEVVVEIVVVLVVVVVGLAVLVLVALLVSLVVVVAAAAADADGTLGEFDGEGKNVIFTLLFLLLAGDRLRAFDNSLLALFAIAGRLPTCAARTFHVFLQLASFCTSSKVKYDGRSMKSPPFESFPNCARVASFTSRESFMRRRCPNQRNLRRRIAFTRSKVRVDALTSMCASLPVNLLD